MSQSLFISPFNTVFFQGRVAVGAKMFFYETGTLAPIDIFASDGTPLDNPIASDLYGHFVPIYIGNDVGEYRVQLQTSTGSVIDDVDPTDNVLGELSSSAGAGFLGFSQTNSYDQGTLGLHGLATLSVKDAPFNAVGDGSHDDTAALQAAIDFGQAVYIPHGRYKVTSSLTISSPITIYGDGMVFSRIESDGTFDVFDITTSGQHGLFIAHVGLKNTSATPAVGDGIKLTNVFMATLDHVRIEGYYNGLHAVGPCGLTIVNRLHVPTVVNAGFFAEGGNCYDFYLSNFVLSGGTYSISLKDMCDEFVFTNGICSSASRGLYTDATVFNINQRPEFCRFVNVSFDSCTTGIDLSQVWDFDFSGCFISNRPDYGAILGDRGQVRNVRFRGCNFFFNGKNAARMGQFSNQITFEDCLIGNSSQSSPLAYSDIFADTGSGVFRILNCTQGRDNDVATARPNYWLVIAAVGQPYYQVSNNSLTEGAGARGTVVTNSTTTINITAITEGFIRMNDTITATGIPSGATITGFLSGAGGTGTYTISAAATASATVSFSSVWGQGLIADLRMGAGRIVTGNLGYPTYSAGTASLSAGTVSVKFPLALPDTNYRLTLAGDTAETFTWSSKTVTGFTITSSNVASTAAVDWTANDT